MKTAIMTDTNSGISVKEGKESGIFVLPLPILIEDEDHLEGESISHMDIFTAMKEGRKVSTSQPAPGELVRMWEHILNDGYDEVVYIPMTSGLSGSYETASLLAKDYRDKVFVVNNHRISMTLLDSVYDAKYLADGGMTGSYIKKRLETVNRSIIYIMVNDLKYIVKSGRITGAGAAIATVVGIRPVLKIESGKLDAFDKARGVKKCEDVMLNAVKHQLEKFYNDVEKEHISIGIAGTMTREKDVRDWIGRISDTFRGFRIGYKPLSCSIACHIGSETKGIAIGRTERPYDGA